MVNNAARVRETVDTLVRVYVAVVVATIAVLAVLSAVGSGAATGSAWIHAVIVAVFAVLLPLRLRAAHRGSADAWRAVGIIAAVLAVVNVAEALVPGLFPGWMRVECVGIAVLMAAVVLLVARGRR